MNKYQVKYNKKTHYKAQTKYNKINTLGVLVRLNNKTDKDIIDKLDYTNKSGWFKSMVRKGIEYDKRLERLNK